MVYRRMGGMKKEKQVSRRDMSLWRGFDASVCVSFNRSQSTTNENAHRSHVIV